MNGGASIDPFSVLPERASKLLVVLFDPSSASTERATALAALDAVFKDAKIDCHAIREKLITPTLNREDLQKLFDAGREMGQMEETARRQKAAATIAKIRNSNKKVEDEYKGYAWTEIVGFCSPISRKLTTRGNWSLSRASPARRV